MEPNCQAEKVAFLAIPMISAELPLFHPSSSFREPAITATRSATLALPISLCRSLPTLLLPAGPP